MKPALIASLGGSTYLQRALSLNPLAYYPLNDLAGTTAIEIINGWNGIYQSCVLGEPGIGDGMRSVYMNYLPSCINLYHAGFSPAWNGDEFTISQWVKPYDLAFWNDGLTHDFSVIYGVAAGNLTFARKDGNFNVTMTRYHAGTPKVKTAGSQSWVNWTNFTWSASVSNNRLRLWIAGVRQTPDITGLGAWDHTGGLSMISTNYGSGNSAAPIHSWQGWVCHLGLFNRELSDNEVQLLARG